jgi:hypothetical protein
MCPDDMHYRIGYLIGSVIGGILGGKAGGELGKFCFAAGTLVQTKEGEKPIEELKAGDVVLASDPQSGEAPQWREVARTFERVTGTILHVRVGSETISVTPEHPFWVEGRGWTQAKDLRAGDLLSGKRGESVLVGEIKRSDGAFKVHNFEVAGLHTYFVAHVGLLVHNSCKTLKPGPHADESIPARGPQRDFTPTERGDINRIGKDTGCHTCGSTDPGTKSGNFIPDHQPANQLNPTGGPQRLYPHCLSCSRIQGGEVRQATRP